MTWKVQLPSPMLIVLSFSFIFEQNLFTDYGFEYSDEEVEEEDVDIENQYYNSKGIGHGCVWEAFSRPRVTLSGVQVCWRAVIRQKPCEAFKRSSRWSQTRLSGKQKGNIVLSMGLYNTSAVLLCAGASRP